jgi:hypothetical protein
MRVSILPGPPEMIRLRTVKLTTPPIEWLTKILAGLAAPPPNN